MKMLADPTTDIVHAVDTTWEDVDVTAYVGGDAGSVAGVMLRLRNNGSGPLAYGVRKNGSGETTTADLRNADDTIAYVGVDSGDVFELYLEDASEFSCFLVGYWTTAEAEFLTTLQDVTPGTTGSYQNVSLGAYFTGTVQAALLMVVNAANAIKYVGAQDVDGSDRYGPIVNLNMIGLAAVCTSEDCEVYVEDANLTVYVIGAITANITKITEDSFTPTQFNTYEDKTISGVDSAAVAVMLQFHDGTGQDAGAHNQTARANGTSYDLYGQLMDHPFYFGHSDGADIEVKSSNTDRNWYFVAYLTEPSDAAPDGQVVTTYLNDIA